MMQRLLLVLFFGLVQLTGYGQKYAFKNYSTAEGLPQSQVTSIAQDKDGYLWVGTLGGIAKFNGTKFTNYTIKEGLYNLRISSLDFIDDQLYVGHDGGVSVGRFNKFTNVSLPDSMKTIGVTGIVKFKEDVIVATNGGGVFQLKGERLIPLEVLKGDSLRVRDIQVVNNAIYLATKKGPLKTTDFKSYTRIANDFEHSCSAIELYGEHIYISSWGKGVLKLDHEDQLVEHILGYDTTKHRVNNLMITKTGEFWLTSQFGVIRMDGQEVEYIDNKLGLSTDLVNVPFEDNEGGVWIGSMGKGLIRAPKGRLQYYGLETGFPTDLFVSGFQDKNGVYYYGTYDFGLLKMEDEKLTKIELSPIAGTIWAAQEDVDGAHWFGAKTGLFAVYPNGSIREFDQDDGTPGNKITCFLKASSNSMFIGGRNGVVFYSNGTFKEVATNNKVLGTARSIELFENELIVGSDLGLFKLENDEFVPMLKEEGTVFCLQKDGQKNLWIGKENGLYVYNGEKVKKIDFSPEVASNNIVFLNYRNKRLYVGTYNGLFIFSGEDLVKSPLIRRLGLSEGLVDLESNLNSSFFDNQGAFWFGSSSGLMSFDPEKFVKDDGDITLKVISLLVNFKPVQLSQWELDENQLPLNFSLPYSKNSIFFEMDAITIGQQSGSRFQYWLEGLEASWGPPSTNVSVSYAGLSPGQYTLHARILDVYGDARDQIDYSFEIRPPFYLTWWFISVVVIALIVIIIMIFQFRLKREREKSENEKLAFKTRLMTLEQQSLNASMNRHFIFNALNSIQFFINSSDKLSANRYLTNFAKLIRKNLDSSAEQGSMVTMAQEIERLELYMSLESMRFKDRFTYQIVNEGLDAESILIPAMLIQPFVENSIIHGILPNEDVLGELLVRLYEEGDTIYVQVEDNGIGIDNSLKSKAEFKGDHKSQGMEITFKRIDLIRKVSNQSLEIIGPVQIEDNNGLIKGTRVTLKIRQEYLDN